MRMNSTVACAAAFLFCVLATGCHTTGGHGCDDCAGPAGCGYGGCDFGGGCTSGSCGGLAGMLGGALGVGCNDPNNCVTPETLTADGYGVRGGVNGPLAGHFGIGQHHRGPQSHMGPVGPADGPPIGQTTYPYYTTRGPRDFFASKPASIGP